MTITTAIAIYAAGVGTAGFAWQVFGWWRANHIRLRVHAEGDLSLRGPRNVVTAVRVVVLNDSPFEVRIRRVFLLSFEGSDPHRMWLPDEGEEDLSAAVAPRDRLTFHFAMTEGDLFGDQP